MRFSLPDGTRSFVEINIASVKPWRREEEKKFSLSLDLHTLSSQINPPCLSVSNNNFNIRIKLSAQQANSVVMEERKGKKIDGKMKESRGKNF